MDNPLVRVAYISLHVDLFVAGNGICLKQSKEVVQSNDLMFTGQPVPWTSSEKNQEEGTRLRGTIPLRSGTGKTNIIILIGLKWVEG